MRSGFRVVAASAIIVAASLMIHAEPGSLAIG
jgi:hypothetical protein